MTIRFIMFYSLHRQKDENGRSKHAAGIKCCLKCTASMVENIKDPVWSSLGLRWALAFTNIPPKNYKLKSFGLA